MKALSKIATGSLGLALLFSSLTAVGANAVEAGADGQKSTATVAPAALSTGQRAQCSMRT